MVNKIDGVSGQRPTVPNPGQNARADRANAERGSGPAQGSDQLSLTSSAQLLKELNDVVASTPEVDASRVEAIKQAIADGSYQVDAGRIADQLLKLEDQL
jgi:negative regulator of flagellin synthesis FlgM